MLIYNALNALSLKIHQILSRIRVQLCVVEADEFASNYDIERKAITDKKVVEKPHLIRGSYDFLIKSKR